MLLCIAGVVGLSNGALAQPEPRLRAPRLSLALAIPNTVLFGIAGGSLFASAADADSNQERRRTFGAASAYTALAVANFGWIIHAGSELSDRRYGADDRLGLKTARIETAFSIANTAVRATVFAIGAAFIATPPGDGLGRAGYQAAGIALVVTNSVLLPFHIWAAVVHIKELRWRKRGVDPYRARRLTPMPGGFMF